MGLLLVLLAFLAITASMLSPSECQDVKKIAELNNQLAADIHRKLMSTGDENVFFSPLSISTALAMLYYGTRGKTAEEMRLALGYQDASLTDRQVHLAFQSFLETISKDSVAKNYLLYFANAMLIQRGFPILTEYRDGLREIYKATTSDVDFRNDGKRSLRAINDWVRLKTNGQINKLLDDIDPSTIMVLLNVIYFKGTWKTQFDPKNTMEKVFFNRGLTTEAVKVPMMHLVEELSYARLSSARVLELPYKNEDISMLIILPDAIDGLDSREQELSSDTLRDMRKLTRKTKVRVTLPKFTLNYKKNLNTVLQELGIKDVFENSADLSGISKVRPIAVSKVVHNAVVEVNEEGSEASGVTGVIIEIRMGGIQHNEFVANHPFLFAIIDRRNDMILFQGRVNKL